MRVHTDLPLKRLFALRSTDLLELTGDRGARVEAAESLEIAASARRADHVLRLRGRDGPYLRHVEFQSDCPPDLHQRCFDYNTRLHLHSGLPVVTTVVFVKPPGPRGRPVYEVRLGRQVLHRWHFEWVKLWEIDARPVLERGELGLAVLVPLMRAGSWKMVQRVAGRVLSEAPREQQPDLLAALTVFAGVRYPAEDIGRLAGRRIMLESSAWEWVGAQFERRGIAKGEQVGMAKGVAKGEQLGMAKGKRVGELSGARKLCLQILKAFQPELLARARPVVQACGDSALLQQWSVKAPRLDSAAFARLLGIARKREPGASVRRRIPVPARKSRR